MFEIVLLLIILPLAISLISSCVVKKIETNRSLVSIFLSNSIAQILISYLIVVNCSSILDLSSTLFVAFRSLADHFYLLAGVQIIIMVIYLAIKVYIGNNFDVEDGDAINKKEKIQMVGMTMVFLLGVILIALTLYFKGSFGNISPEQAIYNLQAPMDGIASSQTSMIFFGPVLNIIGPLALFIWWIVINRKYFRNNKLVFFHKRLLKIASILALLVLVIGSIFFYIQMQIGHLATQLLDESRFYQDYYIDPKTVQLKPMGKKRNVIHIFLESIENTYLSKDLGGDCQENLIPNLSNIAQEEGVVFSDNNGYFGGPQQTFGSSWSAAGMVNMQSGIPIKVSSNNDAYGKKGYFLPGITNSGDLLNQEGYNQSVMFGADANFAGLQTYYETHGHFNVLDIKWAKNQGLIHNDYLENWGFEDEKLLAWAVDELNNLASQEKPFNFVLETADTHFPNGYIGPHTPTPYDSSYANAIHYSDELVSQFIRWCQQQPWYENTTIIVNGDHLSMDTEFFKQIDPHYNRTVFNMIINPANPVNPDYLRNRQWAPLDYFPTIMSAIGYQYEGARLGLGTDLFSGQPTLMEQLGFVNFNKGLMCKSRYYEHVFIRGEPYVEQPAKPIKKRALALFLYL